MPSGSLQSICCNALIKLYLFIEWINLFRGLWKHWCAAGRRWASRCRSRSLCACSRTSPRPTAWRSSPSSRAPCRSWCASAPRPGMIATRPSRRHAALRTPFHRRSLKDKYNYIQWNFLIRFYNELMGWFRPLFNLRNLLFGNLMSGFHCMMRCLQLPRIWYWN